MPNLKQFISHWKGVLILAPSVAFCVILGDFWGIFQGLEWSLVDRFFRLRPLEPVDERIAIVTIEEADLTEVGQWPFPDRVLAQLLDKISSQQPRAIGLNLYRDLPVEPGYGDLVNIFESTPNLIGVEKIIGTAVAPPPILAAAGQVAMSDMVLDADGKVRRALISAANPEGNIQLSLAMRVALIYLAKEQITPEAGDDQGHQVKLGKFTIAPLRTNSGGYVRGDIGGYQILLNYRGSDDRFLSFSMSDVLSDRIDPTAMRDRIVLIGVTAPSLNDLFQTPYNRALFAPPSELAGIVIHANVASQILSGALDGRPLLQVLPGAAPILWIILWSFIGAVDCWVFRNLPVRGKYYFVGRTFLTVVTLAVLLVGGSYVAFCFGWVIPVASPLVALWITAIAIAFYHDRQQLKITNQKLAVANEQLEDYSHTLEGKVATRTRELEKAKKAALAASEAKSEFLSQMSHELRTPLNGILGYAQILERDRSLGDKQLKGIETISQCGYYLLNLINEILDLSKIEARKMELNPQDFDFPLFLQGVGHICQIKAEQKEIQFFVAELTPLPLGIYSDEKRLRQVLINLLGNAIKFTDNGSVSLKVGVLTTESVAESEKALHRIRFAIEDSGVGMTPDQLEKIFLPFEQVGDRDRMVEGTGLGLAISKKIVQMLGSQLKVKSDQGIGTTFWFDLDLLASTESIAAIDPESGDNSAHNSARNIVGYQGRPRKILVVDNLPESRLFFNDFLASFGFTLSLALNGKEGIEEAVAFQPDAIIADLLMPEMDGFEMIEQLRKLPEFKQVPCLAISASVFDSDKRRSLSAGYNSFLPKPIEAPELLEQLQKYLSLEWIYEEVEADLSLNPMADPTSSKSAISLPSPDELLRLYEAAQIGDIDEIEQAAIQLKTLNEEYVLFANRVLEMAAEFEDQKILTLIEPHCGGKHHGK